MKNANKTTTVNNDVKAVDEVITLSNIALKLYGSKLKDIDNMSNEQKQGINAMASKQNLESGKSKINYMQLIESIKSDIDGGFAFKYSIPTHIDKKPVSEKQIRSKRNALTAALKNNGLQVTIAKQALAHTNDEIMFMKGMEVLTPLMLSITAYEIVDAEA